MVNPFLGYKIYFDFLLSNYVTFLIVAIKFSLFTGVILYNMSVQISKIKGG